MPARVATVNLSMVREEKKLFEEPRDTHLRGTIAAKVWIFPQVCTYHIYVYVCVHVWQLSSW